MSLNLFKNSLYYFFSISIFFLNINAQEVKPSKELIWEKEKKNKLDKISNPPIWEKYKNEDLIDYEKKSIKINQGNSSNSQHEKDIDLEFIDYGYAVTSANSISKNAIRIEVGQVSTFDGGESGGTGNQNYFSRIYYGINNKTNFSVFFTEGDDPLYSKISLKNEHPSNLWTNIGFSYKKIFYEENKYKLGFETSLERWRVKSGGCDGFGCDKSKPTNNIFNDNLETIDNTNTVSSIALALTKKFNENFEYTILPKYTFLPSKQKDGEFFGNNFGLGMGGKYSFNKKFRIYNSVYFPIAFGNNSFDSQLKFQKKLIHNIGASYSFDPEISLEAYLTNSFGSSPGTSILTLPSSDELMFGGRLIYTPKFNGEYFLDKEGNKNQKFYKNKSFISTASLLKRGKKSLDYGFSNDSSDFYNLRIGLTRSFNLDFSSELINSENKKYKNFTSIFLENGTRSARGGGILKIFSQERGDLISTNLRLSFGRVMGKIRNGYMFGEIINKYSKNDRLSFNLNPKFSITGNGNIYSIGSSLNWKLNPRIALIPEANIGLHNSENNLSLTGRKYLSENIIIDSYISNSFGMIDMAKQFKSENTKYGIKFKLLF